MAYDFEGKTALITGAARGIGAATARELGRLGARVVLSDIDGDAVGKTAKNLQKQGLQAEPAELDICDAAAVNDLIAGLDRLDILVANAGMGARMPAEEMPVETWQRVMDVNLTGTFQCCQAAAKPMLDQGSGAIVIVASIMGLVGGGLYPNAAYQTSKGGLVNMTRTLALEWASRGIRVNAVAPTFARTALTTQLLADDEMARQIVDNTPMGRLVEPEEVASAIGFLASDAAAMITGVTLPVDGGWTAR